MLTTATIVACFSIYYAAAGIFKANTQVVNDLKSGLTAYWTFDGQDVDWSTGVASDKSGNNRNGQMVNMATSTSPATGKIGQALNFNAASSQYISTGVPTRTLLTSSNPGVGTISVWMRPTGSAASYSGSWPYGLPSVIGDVSNVAIGISRGDWTGYGDKIWIYNGWDQAAKSIGAAYTVGEWTHIVFMKDGVNFCMYKDGSQVDCVADSDRIAAGTFLIGTDGTYFTGDIDEVRTYNRGLSASEIAELYNQGAKRLATINASANSELTDGLVMMQSFNGEDINWAAGTAIDGSGQGNNGMINNMSTSTSPAIGKLGQALNFGGQGSGDYVSSSGAGLSITDYITVSAWFKPDSGAFNQYEVIVSKVDGNGSWNRGYQLYLYDGKINFYVTQWDGNNASKSFTNDNNWHHVVGTYDGANVRVYLDGVEGTADPYTGSINMAGAIDLRIGCSSSVASAPNYFFGGLVDEVRVYHRALPASQVRELYSQGAKRFLTINAPQTELIPSGLIGYWTFNGEDTNWSSNNTNDRSGNNNTGTMTNMPILASPAVGIAGQGLYFDGSNDIVALANNSVATTLSDFTVSAWVKSANFLDKQYHTIVGFGAVGDEMFFGLKSGKMVLYADSLSGHEKVANTTLGHNAWHHIVFTRSGANYNFYLNGAGDGGGAWVSTAIVFNDGFRGIGNDNSVGEEYSGILDEVRIYSRALSASEVTELYRAGSSR